MPFTKVLREYWRAAKGTKNDVKDEFIASLEDNAYFNWVKNSDPDVQLTNCWNI